MTANLRDRLRSDCSAAHRQLDAALAGDGFGSRDGRDDFLAALVAGYRAVTGLRFGSGSAARVVAERSLRAAGERPPVAPLDGPVIDEDGAAYVLLGAHLGARVLARQWCAVTGGAAPPILDLPPPTEEWRALTARLSGRPPSGPAAHRTVGDAIRLFDTFHAGVSRARSRVGRAA